MKKPPRDYVRASIRSADALVYQPCSHGHQQGPSVVGYASTDGLFLTRHFVLARVVQLLGGEQIACPSAAHPWAVGSIITLRLLIFRPYSINPARQSHHTDRVLRPSRFTKPNENTWGSCVTSPRAAASSALRCDFVRPMSSGGLCAIAQHCRPEGHYAANHS